jgi:hypothetical protein
VDATIDGTGADIDNGKGRGLNLYVKDTLAGISHQKKKQAEMRMLSVF